jgi:uncharacterized membrane protein YoaK (UPF0700 family)
MSTWTNAPGNWLPWSLAVVGGFGDAAGLVLAHTFTGHITGNLVLAAVSAAAWEWQATLARLAAVVFFLAGVVLSLALARTLSLRRPSFSPLSSAMAVEVILITGGYWALAHRYAGSEIFVVLLALALGVQNGAVRRAGSVSVHTTYLTGMITALMVAAADRLRSPISAAAAGVSDPRAGLVGGTCATFFLGAAIAAALVHRFNAAGILWILPVLVVVGVAGSRAAPQLQPAG